MASKYQSGAFPDFINKLSPGLKHIVSFINAISSAAQAAAPATLTWEAIQAVMEEFRIVTSRDTELKFTSLPVKISAQLTRCCQLLRH